MKYEKWQYAYGKMVVKKQYIRVWKDEEADLLIEKFVDLNTERAMYFKAGWEAALESQEPFPIGEQA